MFTLEMILKLTAFGFFEYLRNPYNIFDGIIVIISVCEIIGQSDGGLSVLRTFRLLRVIKLVRFMPALRRQLVVLMKTMDNVATFCMLLMLFIFIFSYSSCGNVSIGIPDRSSRSTRVRSDTDVGREGLALSLRSNPSQRCSIGWRSGLCAGQSSSSTPDSLIHVFMELALCTGVRSCWNRKGPSPNCPHKAGSMEQSRVSWSAEALRVPLTGTKGRSLTPEHHPHTMTPPPPNSTLSTVQSDQYRSPGTTKPRLVHQTARRRSVIGHSREHTSTAPENTPPLL
ncbi:hypothetical protein NFI96_007850 [Prochilodus magdalenae]|nr:hypothetical protein NFI96_007850 [Prochilodus magdalenae]